MSRLARTYLTTRARQDRLLHLVQSVSIGVWLGVLSPADLDAVDDAYYVGSDRTAKSPVDYANADWNRRGLAPWERAAIEAHFPPGASIALLGAGGGREVLALRRLSYAVDAWECQPGFVEAANALLVAEGHEPTVHHAPRNTVPAVSKSYDAVIIGWGSYTLIRGRERRVELLRGFRSLVGDGSPLFLSFFARNPRNRQLLATARVGNAVARVLGREAVEVGDSLDPNFVHWFSQDELESELHDGGFELTYFRPTPYGHAVGRAT
jgi:hypothetical protein